jgi:hypothetical protein
MSSINFEALPVGITYVDEIVSPWNDSRIVSVDQWQVKISSEAGFWSINYYTGTGLRCNGFPVKPKILHVLRSLVNDARSVEDCVFTDWCRMFGYSNDSIKALNTYKQCLEISIALKKHFDRETLEALREAAEELDG